MSRDSFEIGRKISRICSLLADTYGTVIVSTKRPPLEVLVRGILSQNTNDVNMDKAYRSLKGNYSSWEEVLNASEEELGEVIKSSGFFRVKAERIKATLEEIRSRVGRLDLSFLESMETQEAMNWLTSLHGIGPKTAALVLLFCFEMPVLPVDTHVWRISKRLGLVQFKTTREATQKYLEEVVPKSCLLSMNHNLVAHGREVCKAKKPLCNACVLSQHCDYLTKSKSSESE
ncbi:MAG: endonuclease III domain-containing protein [Candidatus Hodarchaeota archaeon]